MMAQIVTADLKYCTERHTSEQSLEAVTLMMFLVLSVDIFVLLL